MLPQFQIPLHIQIQQFVFFIKLIHNLTMELIYLYFVLLIINHTLHLKLSSAACETL